jgi:hypothetical protein
LITLSGTPRAPARRRRAMAARSARRELSVSVEFVLKSAESSAQLLADFYILPPCLG